MSSATSSRKPRYSVIIVTYNSRENIRVCLDSLRRCGSIASDANAGGLHEIIVVDNASRDGTGDYLTAQDDIRAILNTVNNGFSKGCNQGAAIAQGDYVIFLNPDTLATPGWAETMARHFQDPSVGAVGPVSNYVAGLQRLDANLPAEWRTATSFPGNGAVEVADNLARILKEGNADKGVTTKLLIGFCLMMPRPLYESMDGMDENLFLGNDDLDLSWRLRNLGRKLVVASDAFVFHEGQKSFKTEAKTTVDRLTQESTDAMYVKLVHHYGGRDKVPAPLELWGIGWFNPSPSLLHGAIPALPAPAGLSKNVAKKESEANVKSESRELTAWKAITALVYVGPDAESPGSESAASRLERTLATLPARPGIEIIVLNCSGLTAAPEAPAGATLRKLDLGSGIPLKQALEIAMALLPGSHGLFCVAGVEFSAMFNHWLDKHDLNALGASLPLPLRIGAEDKGAACAAYAFLGRKEWLSDALASMPSADAKSVLAALGERLVRDAAAKSASGKSIDPPWLLARAADLPAVAIPASAAPVAASMPKTSNESWTPVAHSASRQSAPGSKSGATLDGFNLYPESLRSAMRGSKEIGFAGTTAEQPPTSGPFCAFDAQGSLVPVSDQDLIILRVTPDLIDGLSERMANIRRQAPGLMRFIAVFNGADARRVPATSALAPVDLTPEGMRTALWRAGFAVTGERPYLGFPNANPDGADLRGWSQLEAIPRSAAHHTEKMVSIVILGFNQMEYTKKCIESIRKYTRQKYELILVDNGSKDGTEAFFRSIPGAKVIRNAENLGVSKGWNQGMRLATGEYILILNNDIIVGPDWLENMVRLAESDPSIGLVGPRSNYIAGPQVVADVPYKAEGEIQDFIRQWQGRHALSAAEFGFIKGFCHLIPRRVFAKVGFYDERFGKGNFEDDDYCMRVRIHGFRALFADDCFIHHYGSVSFNQESVDWRALMIENQKKYEQKWAKGAAAVNDTQVSVPGEAPAAIPAPRSAPGKLEQGRMAYENGDLKRARILFLEAQGESPSDPEPYCSLGALMFSEGATQEAVSFFMRCLNLDPAHADAAQNLLDTLSARNGEVSPEECAALVSRYPGNRVFAAALASSGTRAVPAQAAPSSPAPVPAQVKTAGLPAWTPAPAAPAFPAWQTEVENLIESAKYTAAMDLLESRVRRNEDPGPCYNYLGIIAHACGDADLALKNFATALKHAPGEADILFNLSDTLLAVGRSGDAAKLLEDSAHKTGVESDPNLPDLAATAEQIRHAMSKGSVDAEHLLASRDANQQAERLLRSGALADAKAYLDVALESDGGDFRALNNLGLLAWYREDGQEAWRNFTRCLAVRPAWVDALVNAFDTAIVLGDMGMFAPCLENALASAPNHVQASAMRRHIQAQGLAIHCFKSFDELEANAAALRKAETALEQARQGDAINIYLEALKIQPQNPQVFNGLGIIAFSEKRYGDAFGLFDAAAGLHPTDQDILLNFWQCAQALRREGEVLPKLRNSLERNPALEDIKAVIKEYA
ncbi:MAG: hypothetical protein JWO30_481 [Fibrobacteres bacterium]|nr:hypothetical protein [Fibrobacterota bacterium]